MRHILILGITGILLYGCVCPPGSETKRVTSLSGNVFENTSNRYASTADTFSCKADKLGIELALKDTTLQLDDHNSAHCRAKIEIVYENPPEEITIVSDRPFLSKATGESLNEYFLCANRADAFPSSLTTDRIKSLDHSFVLLLKPDLGVPQNSNVRFITNIKLSDRTLSDTTKTILFQ